MYEALLCDWIVTTTKNKKETNKTEDQKENEDNSNKEETNKTEEKKENEDNNKEEEKSENNLDRVEVAIETQKTASAEQTTVVKKEEKVLTVV